MHICNLNLKTNLKIEGQIKTEKTIKIVKIRNLFFTSKTENRKLL